MHHYIYIFKYLFSNAYRVIPYSTIHLSLHLHLCLLNICLQMVGTPAMPTYWSLGFHLSRWGYNSTDGVRAARERMKAMGIPQVSFHVNK